MADVVSPEVRSRMMSGIKGKNTKPELILRSGLHRRGFRFRLHAPDVPGKPDMLFPKYRGALFAHGCFWHGHDCDLFRLPATRPDFWKTKIDRNRWVDARNSAALASAGWREGVVWECALKGKARLPLQVVLERCSEWLDSDCRHLEVRGG